MVRFSEELSELARQQAPSLQAARGQFDGLCETRHGLVSAMCQLDRVASAIEETASVGLVIGGVVLLAGNPIVFTTLAAILLTPGGQVAAAVASAAWALSKLTSDVPARKEKFVSSKMEKARKGLDAFEAQIRSGIEQYYQEIWQSFMTSVKDRYLPLLAEVQASVEEARLRHQLHLRIREDTLRLVDELAALPAPAR